MTHLTLLVLGALQVSVDGEPVKTFRSAKTRALLVYLALENNRPHTRDALAGLLWPDQLNQTARDNLRQILAILRKAIGDSGNAQSASLDITRDTIQFNPGSDHFVDAVAFTALLNACATHRHRHSETCRSCAENRRQAIELYRGDFIDQFYLSDSAPFEEWAVLKRERLRELALDALYQLAEFHTRHGDYKQALTFALRQLELDPWREEAHRQAMCALALDGRHSAALAQYENCRRRLADEMGVEPAQETIALHEAIKDQSLGSPLLVRSPDYHLPSSVTPLLGRAAELANLDRLLSDPGCRLISIVGPGGIGKTRLAIVAAEAKKLEFKEGVFFISLASLGSAGLLAPTLLAAIGAPAQGQRDSGQQLINYLREREVLLVLDNMEHLLEGTQLLAELLRRAPCVALLVTSRERLNLQGEWVLDLHGLEVPEGEKLEEVERYSAVQLFLQNAKRGRAESSFSDEERATIVRICRMVEGMPLAIELAAAWARTLSCRQIADEMEKSYGFLTTALRDIPQRHRSMRAVFEHSWNLLNAEERGALRRLGVFQGGFQREAAEQVAAASLPLLAALVDKSLVRSTTPEWYDLHHLVRQFAHEELVEARESEETHRRYADYYLALAERAEPEFTTSSQTQWFNLLDIEHANIRAVLAWSREHNAELGLKLCGSIWRFWEWHNFIGEGRAWLEAFIAQSLSPTAARGKALRAASALAVYQGDYEAAGVHMEEALPIFQQLGDKRGIAAALNELGAIAWGRGRLADARQLFEQSLVIKRELGDDWLIANSLVNLGVVASYQSDYASAYALHQESLALYRVLNEMGGIAIASSNLGYVAMHLGKMAEAQTRQAEGLRLFNEVGDKDGLAECLERFAMLANANANFRCAARLFGAASVLRKEAGTVLTLVEQAEYDSELRATRVQLDTATFDAVWQSGQAMTIDQMMELALSEVV